jgi:sigma-B regulation protein RsbU (phosphoserine phosphatase)
MEGIRSFSDRRFVTLITALIDSRSRELRFVNAGHPPGIVRAHETGVPLRQLDVTGPLISPAFAGETWTESRLTLEPGDQLVLYTDGVSDVYGDGRGMFSDRRVHEIVFAHRDSGEALIASIIEAVTAFAQGRPFGDDLTLLTARILP